MKLSILKVITIEVMIVAFGILALGFAKDSFAADPNNYSEISVGLNYQDGQSELIDSDDVTTTRIPVSLTHKKDKFSFGITLSHVTVDDQYREEQGLGDTVLSLGYDLNKAFTVTLKEKIATGDEDKNLSTGKNDTSLQIDFETPMLDRRSTVFATAGHKFVGKNSELNMQNSSFASVGTGYIYNNRTKIGVSLDYRQSIFEDLDDQLGLSAYIDKPLNDTYSLSAFAGYDNTQSSSIGVTLSGKF